MKITMISKVQPQKIIHPATSLDCGRYDPDCSQKLFDDFKMSGNLSKIEDYSNENYFNRQKYHQIKVASVLGITETYILENECDYGDYDESSSIDDYDDDYPDDYSAEVRRRSLGYGAYFYDYDQKCVEKSLVDAMAGE